MSAQLLPGPSTAVCPGKNCPPRVSPLTRKLCCCDPSSSGPERIGACSAVSELTRWHWSMICWHSSQPLRTRTTSWRMNVCDDGSQRMSSHCSSPGCMEGGLARSTMSPDGGRLACVGFSSTFEKACSTSGPARHCSPRLLGEGHGGHIPYFLSLASVSWCHRIEARVGYPKCLPLRRR